MNLDHPVIRFRPKFPALLVCPDIRAKMANQAILAVPALLGHPVKSEYKDLPANPEPMAILADPALKATRDFRATLEPLARMDIPVPRAKFPALLGLKVQLVDLVTMGLLVRMVFPVALDIQAKMASQALPDTQVYYQIISLHI